MLLLSLLQLKTTAFDLDVPTRTADIWTWACDENTDQAYAAQKWGRHAI